MRIALIAGLILNVSPISGNVAEEMPTPVVEQVAVVSENATTSVTVSKMEQVQTQVANVSAYTASEAECGKADGITASGTVAVEGRTIACNFLPFGTRVRINGSEYVVEDRMASGYGNHIDIYMESKHDAIEFGRQRLEVEIIGNGTDVFNT